MNKNTRIKYLLAATAIGLLFADTAVAQDAAAPIRRSSPPPAEQQTPTPAPEATATPSATATPEPEEPTPTATANAVPEETPADRPTPEVEQSRPEVPTAKPVAEEDESPAPRTTPSRRVIQEKPVRAIERRPASEPRPQIDERPDDPPARRSNARIRREDPPVLQGASRPTFDLSERGGGYVAATIRGLEQKLQRALTKQDLETLDELIADDFVGTSTTGRLGSKAKLLSEVKRDKNTYSSARVGRMVVRTQGERTAVVTGISKETGKTPSGERFSNSRRFTDTWVQRDGRWQCIASSVTQLPN